MGAARAHVADDEDEDDEEHADDAQDDDERQRQHLPLALLVLRVLPAGHLAALAMARSGTSAGTRSELGPGSAPCPCRRRPAADVREDLDVIVVATVRASPLAVPKPPFVVFVVAVVLVGVVLAALGLPVQGLQEVLELLTPVGVGLGLGRAPVPEDPPDAQTSSSSSCYYSSASLVGQGEVPDLQAGSGRLVELVELEERSAQRVAVFPARLADDLVLGARAALEAVRGVLGALVVAVRAA